MSRYGRAKYNNRKITVDDIVFDSRKEYLRWLELASMQKRGEISDLQRQVKIELIPSQYITVERIGKKGQSLKPKQSCIERPIFYIADFVYLKNGEYVYEDVKGYKGGTAYTIFTMKRKLARYLLGIEIKEI